MLGQALLESVFLTREAMFVLRRLVAWLLIEPETPHKLL